MGIIIIDTWKGIRRLNRCSYSVTDSVDILAKEMLEQALWLQVCTNLINIVIEQSDSNSCLTTVSSLTACTGNKRQVKY